MPVRSEDKLLYLTTENNIDFADRAIESILGQ
jgi:hypothetical protein